MGASERQDPAVTSARPAGTGHGAVGLAIVTVAYASQEPLERLAADLTRQTSAPQRWLVVDNAPRSSPLRLSEGLQAAAAERLEGGEGEGFGEGCNRAFERLAADHWQGWVWLLNPDTALGESSVVERFSRLLATQPGRALVGTAVWTSAGDLEASGGWIDAGVAFRRRKLQAVDLEGARLQPLSLNWLSGCSLALRPTLHAPPARFEPALPLYYEDMDLCLRLGRAGAPVLWTSAVAVSHRVGSGSGGDPRRRQRLTTLSYWRFLQRHCSFPVRLARGCRLVAMALMRFPLAPDRSLAVLSGLAEAVRHPLR